MTLESLIAEANESGWAVTLRQHPDGWDYWECSISRRLPKPHEDGIVREVMFAKGHTPIMALDNALSRADKAEVITPNPQYRPANYIDSTSIMALLNLKPASNLPPITRR